MVDFSPDAYLSNLAQDNAAADRNASIAMERSKDIKVTLQNDGTYAYAGEVPHDTLLFVGDSIVPLQDTVQIISQSEIIDSLEQRFAKIVAGEIISLTNLDEFEDKYGQYFEKYNIDIVADSTQMNLYKKGGGFEMAKSTGGGLEAIQGMDEIMEGEERINSVNQGTVTSYTLFNSLGQPGTPGNAEFEIITQFGSQILTNDAPNATVVGEHQVRCLGINGDTNEDVGVTGSLYPEQEDVVVDILESPVLPAVLRSFGAVMRDNGFEADIRWVIDSESGVGYYEVKGSIDGRERFDVCTEPSQGNSTEQQVYQCLLNLRESGVISNEVFLQLTAVDLDGSQETFQIATLEIDGVKGLLSVGPNPTSDYIRIDAQSSNIALGQNTPITLYDGMGRQIFRDIPANGSSWYEIDMINLSTGMYFLDIAGIQTKILKD